ncbi:MAG: cytochrome c oxidase assembly protein [Caldimonas sp.]
MLKVVAVAIAWFAIGLFPVEAHGVAETARPVAAHLHWSFDPWLMLCLGLSGGVYAAGVARLWRHAGRRRGVGAAQIAAFAAGWLAIIAALVSPLDALADQLFSAHMVEHEILMIVAAPLLVLGRPLAVWIWALPAAWRGPIGALLHRPGWRVPWLLVTGPLWAWILHALALWLWHVPALFRAALETQWIHDLQHISFLGTALLFWWSVLGGASRRERGFALLSLFTTMVHTGALGALLTLSTRVWYPDYLDTAPAWGLSALQDQQLGGIVMWVPAGIVYIVCGLVLMTRWLGDARGVAIRGRSGMA